MSDDRMVTANITEMRTDSATVSNNAIELFAEGNLRPDLVGPVMRLALPYSVGNLTRHGRMAVRDNLISLDQSAAATQAHTVWMLNRELWLDHIKNLTAHQAAGCSCADPGPHP